MYDRDLDRDVDKETSGNFGRIMRSVVQGERPVSGRVDIALAKKEAQELYDVRLLWWNFKVLKFYFNFEQKAGEGKFGTDEIEFVRILCSRSFSQLVETCNQYKQISDKDFEKAVKKELSGDLEKACLAIGKWFELNLNKITHFFYYS